MFNKDPEDEDDFSLEDSGVTGSEDSDQGHGHGHKVENASPYGYQNINTGKLKDQGEHGMDPKEDEEDFNLDDDDHSMESLSDDSQGPVPQDQNMRGVQNQQLNVNDGMRYHEVPMYERNEPNNWDGPNDDPVQRGREEDEDIPTSLSDQDQSKEEEEDDDHDSGPNHDRNGRQGNIPGRDQHGNLMVEDNAGYRNQDRYNAGNVQDIGEVGQQVIERGHEDQQAQDNQMQGNLTQDQRVVHNTYNTYNTYHVGAKRDERNNTQNRQAGPYSNQREVRNSGEQEEAQINEDLMKSESKDELGDGGGGGGRVGKRGYGGGSANNQAKHGVVGDHQRRSKGGEWGKRNSNKGGNNHGRLRRNSSDLVGEDQEDQDLNQNQNQHDRHHGDSEGSEEGSEDELIDEGDPPMKNWKQMQNQRIQKQNSGPRNQGKFDESQGDEYEYDEEEDLDEDPEGGQGRFGQGLNIIKEEEDYIPSSAQTNPRRSKQSMFDADTSKKRSNKRGRENPNNSHGRKQMRRKERIEQRVEIEEIGAPKSELVFEVQNEVEEYERVEKRRKRILTCASRIIMTDNKRSHRFVVVRIKKKDNERVREEIVEYITKLNELDPGIEYYNVTDFDNVYKQKERFNLERVEELGDMTSLTLMMIHKMDEYGGLVGGDIRQVVEEYRQVRSQLTTIGEMFIFTDQELRRNRKWAQLTHWVGLFKQMFKNIIHGMSVLELRPKEFK